MKHVRWKRLSDQRGFTIIPNVVLNRADLSNGAQRTYALLCFYAREDDRAWPGQSGLMRLMGAGERSLRNYLRELEEKSLIEITQRGLGRTNIYTLLPTDRQLSAGLDRQPSAGLDRQPSADKEEAVEEEAVEEREELRSSLRLRAVENSE